MKKIFAFNIKNLLKNIFEQFNGLFWIYEIKFQDLKNF